MTRPPVLLLHGLASSFDHNWREPGWVDLLDEAGRDVLTIDLPGHGIGPHETVPEAYADVPGLVLRRLAGAVPDSTAVDAVGFSLGGQTLLAMAARKPERFRRLAFLGVGDGAVTVSEHRRSDGLADAIASPVEPDEGRARLFWRLARSAGNDPATLAAFVRREVQPLDAAALANITCPVLVVIGERDFVGPADQLMAALPQARRVELRGTDHFGTTSDYRCMEAVLDFLAD